MRFTQAEESFVSLFKSGYSLGILAALLISTTAVAEEDRRDSADQREGVKADQLYAEKIRHQ